MSFFNTAKTVAADVATEATSAAGFDLWAWLMQYGPFIAQGLMIAALVYNAWQRNVTRVIILGCACGATFVLGW